MKKKTQAAFTDGGMKVKRGADVGIVRCCPLSVVKEGGGFRGHVLEVRWRCVNGKEDSSFLFVGRDGKSVFSPSGSWDYIWRIQEADMKRPYSEFDPVLDGWRLASALVGVGKQGWADAAAEILPVAERFIEQRFDSEYLDLPIGRKPTLSEYAFLSGNPERAVGITAFPFLLPYLVAGLAQPDPRQAEKLVNEIDAGSWSLIEKVAEKFGVDVESVRAMHSLPAWMPTCYENAVGSAETDPACFARALSLIEPLSRPKEDDWEEFERLIKWVELAMWDSMDFPERRAIPEAVAAIWMRRTEGKALLLPNHYDMSWRGPFVRMADTLFQGTGRGYAGRLQGEIKVFDAGVWSLLAMLVASDPYDLRWGYSADPGSVRDVFGYATEMFELAPVLENKKGARK